MFRIDSVSDLLECFRPLDRSEVELPQKAQFPIGVKDYFAWVEPSGAKAFLIFRDSGSKHPRGVVFRRGSASALSMCEWCHCVGGGEGVGLLIATAASNRKVGVNICADLSCSSKIRSNPGVNDFPRNSSERQRIRQVVERMANFARQNLF